MPRTRRELHHARARTRRGCLRWLGSATASVSRGRSLVGTRSVCGFWSSEIENEGHWSSHRFSQRGGARCFKRRRRAHPRKPEAQKPVAGSPCTPCLAVTSGAKLTLAKIAPGTTSAGGGRPGRVVWRCRHRSAARSARPSHAARRRRWDTCQSILGSPAAQPEPARSRRRRRDEPEEPWSQRRCSPRPLDSAAYRRYRRARCPGRGTRLLPRSAGPASVANLSPLSAAGPLLPIPGAATAGQAISADGVPRIATAFFCAASRRPPLGHRRRCRRGEVKRSRRPCARPGYAI